MPKRKEKTVPSLIRLETIPPPISNYIRGKPILNHVNVENNTLRVSFGERQARGRRGRAPRARPHAELAACMLSPRYLDTALAASIRASKLRRYAGDRGRVEKCYFLQSKIYVSKWKEATVPSLIRLGTFPPSI